MAINKVIYNGSTLIDLTSDTVSADTLLQGVTAHDLKGESIVGTYVDQDTTYSVSKAGTTITLTGSDGSTSSVTEQDVSGKSDKTDTDIDQSLITLATSIGWVAPS